MAVLRWGGKDGEGKVEERGFCLQDEGLSRQKKTNSGHLTVKAVEYS